MSSQHTDTTDIQPPPPSDGYSAITASIDALNDDIRDLHNRKASVTKPVFASLQAQIDGLKSQLINFLLPLASKAQSVVPATSGQGGPSGPSYANVVSASTAVRHETRRPAPPTSSILIKPSSSSSSKGDVVNQVSRLLGSSSSDATMVKSFSDKNGNTVLKFRSSDDVTTIADNIRTKLGLEARSRSTLKPKMTLTHVPAHVNVNDNFRAQMLEQNPWLADCLRDGGELEVLFHYKPKDFHSVVLKMSANVRAAVLEHNSTIILSNCACPVRDRFHVLRCSNCCKTGHKTADCKVNSVCGFCSEAHRSEVCPHKDDSSKYRCCMCSTNNEHSTFAKQCPVYQNEVNKLIRLTDYGNCPLSF